MSGRLQMLKVEGKLAADETVENVWEKSRDAIVRVCGIEGKERRCGSGFFVDAAGTIATDLHVVENLPSLEITTANGRTLTALPFRTDAAHDLSLLKVKDQSMMKQAYPFLNLGESTKTPIGTDVFAFGYANGRSNQWGSVGWLSNKVLLMHLKGLFIDKLAKEVDTKSQVLVGELKTNVGQSGAPMLDKQGNVIGVITHTDSNRHTVAARVEELKRLLGR